MLCEFEVFVWSKDNCFASLELSFKYRTEYWPNYIAILSMVFEAQKRVQLQLAFAVCSLLFPISQLLMVFKFVNRKKYERVSVLNLKLLNNF